MAAATILVALVWSPPARAADGTPVVAPWVHKSGYITMKDGAELKYSVILPRANGHFPTIVNYGGYDNGSMGDSGSLPAKRYPPVKFVQHGYALLSVQVRGTGCSSGGPYSTFDPRWGTDGAAAVEWAARQPWSTGKVGMFGGSFMGISQLFTAIHRPKGLKAIAPGSVVVDPNRDVAQPGGVTNYLFPLAWWTADLAPSWKHAMELGKEAGDQKCVENAKRNLATAYTPPQMQADHPFMDSYMRRHSLLGKTKRINVPTFSIERFQDNQTGVRGSYYQEGLNPKKTWYLGLSGMHSFQPKPFLPQVVMPFFDHFVKGVNNGFQRRSHTTIWPDVTCPNALAPATEGLDVTECQPYHELTFKHYPPKTKDFALNLRSGGWLTRGKAHRGEKPDTYDYPVPGPSVNDLLAPTLGVYWGPMSDGWRNGSLVYTTKKLKRPLALYGSASANLWVSTTAPDADLQVTVTDVRPNGQEQYIQRGWLRLSDRAIDHKLSNRTRPVVKLTESAVSPPEKGVPVKARLEINKFSHIFERGSRLRIWIEAPSATGYFKFTSKTDPGVNRVYHSPKRPSKVVFSELPGLKLPHVARPKCNHVFFMECRLDPLNEEMRIRQKRHAKKVKRQRRQRARHRARMKAKKKREQAKRHHHARGGKGHRAGNGKG